MDEPQIPRAKVAQAQAARDAENQAAPLQEQPQAQPEVQTQPNEEPVPALASSSEGGDEPASDFTTNTDLMWMKLALMVASRAEISEYAKEKPSVGCVIRRSRTKGPPAVLAVGWNGFPPKTAEDTLKDKAAKYKGKKHALTKILGLHAETNALRNCSENPEKATVYVTHVPCHECAKQLVSHRVKRVFYLFWIDKSDTSRDLFKEFGISCIPFKRREEVLRDFSGTFLADHSICVGGTNKSTEACLSCLSIEDSTRGTSADRKRSMSDSDFQFDKILRNFHEYDIKIVGVPETSAKETAQETSYFCVSLFKEMGAKITINDIDTAQRIATEKDSDGPKPIICKFVRRLARDSVISAKHQVCKVDPVDIDLPVDTDMSKIRICGHDEESQEMTEGATSTQ